MKRPQLSWFTWGLIAVAVMVFAWTERTKETEKSIQVSAETGIMLNSLRGKIGASSDGRVLLKVGQQATVRVWKDGQLHGILPGTHAFLAGDKFLLVFKVQDPTWTHGVEVLSVETLEVVQRLAVGEWIRDLVVSPDANTVVVSNTDNEVSAYNLATGEKVWVYSGEPLSGWPSLDLLCQDRDLDHCRLALFEDDKLLVWDIGKDRQDCAAKLGFQHSGRIGDGRIHQAFFDGRETFVVWNLETCREALRLDGLSHSSLLAIRPGGNLLAVVAKNQSVELWDLESARLQRILEHDLKGVSSSLAFHPRGDLLFFGSGTEGVLWDLEEGTMRDRFGIDRISAGELTASGEQIFGHQSERIVVAQVPGGERVFKSEGQARPIQGIRWSDNSRFLFVSQRFSYSLHIFDFSTGEANTYQGGMSAGVSLGSFEIGSGGRWFAAGTSDRQVYLYRSGESEPYARLTTSGPIDSFTVDPIGGTVATVSNGEPVVLWDGETGERIATLENPLLGVRRMDFGRGGSWLVMRGRDGQVAIWSVDKKKLVADLKPLVGMPFPILWPGEDTLLNCQKKSAWSFGPDYCKVRHLLPTLPFDEIFRRGKATGTLVGFNSSRALATFDLDLEEQMVMEGQVGGGKQFAVSSDGSRIAVGTDHPSLFLWDWQKLEAPTELAGHKSGVDAIAWSPDGRFLASGDLDGEVHIRDAENLEILARIFLPCDRDSWTLFGKDGRWDTSSRICSDWAPSVLSENRVETLPFDFSDSRLQRGFWKGLLENAVQGQ